MASASSGAPVKLPLGLRQALESGDCVLFLGAGVGYHYSRPDGNPAPDAKKLAEDLIKHFKLGIDPTDLARVASIVEIRKSRADLDEFVTKSLQKLEPDDHIKWLTSFRWRAIYTTNYDMGLEGAYQLNSHPLQTPVPISVTSNLIYTDTHVDVPVFHLHGTPFPPCASSMVLTQSDYTKYQDQRKMVWARLKNDFATSVVLYIGYSGRDQNWQLIVEEVAREFSPSKPPTSYRRFRFLSRLSRRFTRVAARWSKPLSCQTSVQLAQSFSDCSMAVTGKVGKDSQFSRFAAPNNSTLTDWLTACPRAAAKNVDSLLPTAPSNDSR